MQSQMLFSDLFALEPCASLQPNSRSWQNENRFAPQGGTYAAPMGYLLDAGLRDVMGELRLVDGFAMPTTRKGFGMADAGGTGSDPELLVTGGKPTFAHSGAIMRPGLAQTLLGDAITGNSGTTGTFKKINTGSHSRLGGLPPLTKAAAPPGCDKADPGGGPTTS